MARTIAPSKRTKKPGITSFCVMCQKWQKLPLISNERPTRECTFHPDKKEALREPTDTGCAHLLLGKFFFCHRLSHFMHLKACEFRVNSGGEVDPLCGPHCRIGRHIKTVLASNVIAEPEPIHSDPTQYKLAEDDDDEEVKE